MMESHRLRMCGVCDKKMKPRATSAACISCQNMYVNLKNCAGLLFREAKKLNRKFNCSKCSVSEIQPTINYEYLKSRINKRDYFVAWFCCRKLCDAYFLASEREAGILLVSFFPKLISVFSWKQNQRDGDNNLNFN